MKNFFEQLPSFSKFNDFTQDGHFEDAPLDWSVIISDIRGSTKAIAEGRYTQVNTMGAASIVVVRKAMGIEDFPFVFGGDGATILVPNNKIQAVKENLAALKDLSLKNYQLELRVGVVNVEDLFKQGKIIQVGKYEITSGKCIAILRGDGITHAEKIIKDSNKYEINEQVSQKADLSGLSCRWNPIPNKNGKIFTILVKSRAGKNVYFDFMNALSNILPKGIEYSNPINIETANYKSLNTRELLLEERKLHDSVISLRFFARALEIVFTVLVFKYKFPAFFFDAKKYANSMRSHSDFRKFDDMLRMVLDCSLEQIAKVEMYLKGKYEEGELFYGTFQADNALMTCFVEGLGQGKHIHFIDAENGGYTSAAIGLKKQMKSALNA